MPKEESKKIKKKKSLGQNFLRSEVIVDQIIEGSNIDEDDLIIEIGPGLGVLTRKLVKNAAKVVAIEIDERFIPVLEKFFAHVDNVKFICADILQVDLGKIIEEERAEAEAKGQKFGGVKILGNLPYYITTPIIMKLLEEKLDIDSITVMMQKEVAERLNAKPGSKEYGALTVSAQYFCDVNKIATVSRKHFSPEPKVDSAVMRLDLREEQKVKLIDEKLFFDCVKRGFSKRRKTMLNCFIGMFGLEKDEMKEQLELAGVDPDIRGEMLSIEDYARLSNHFAREAKDK